MTITISIFFSFLGSPLDVSLPQQFCGFWGLMSSIWEPQTLPPMEQEMIQWVSEWIMRWSAFCHLHWDSVCCRAYVSGLGLLLSCVKFSVLSWKFLHFEQSKSGVNGDAAILSRRLWEHSLFFVTVDLVSSSKNKVGSWVSISWGWYWASQWLPNGHNQVWLKSRAGHVRWEEVTDIGSSILRT